MYIYVLQKPDLLFICGGSVEEWHNSGSQGDVLTPKLSMGVFPHGVAASIPKVSEKVRQSEQSDSTQSDQSDQSEAEKNDSSHLPWTKIYKQRVEHMKKAEGTFEAYVRVHVFIVCFHSQDVHVFSVNLNVQMYVQYM